VILYKLSDRAFWHVTGDVYQTFNDAEKRMRIMVANVELECDLFVTKGRDFRDRRKELKKLGLRVEYPAEAMLLLTPRRRHAQADAGHLAHISH
jgi:hypothetical protein